MVDETIRVAKSVQTPLFGMIRYIYNALFHDVFCVFFCNIVWYLIFR